MSESRAIKTLIVISCFFCAPAMADNPIALSYTPPRVVTIWGVFFNDPEACEQSPCTDSELFREGNPAAVDVCYMTGGRGPAFGWSTFGGAFAEGSSFGCIWSGLGLQDAQAAEIHFVVQKHGFERKDMLTDQLTEFTGGCPPNDCRGVHFAIHLADGEYETQSSLHRYSNGSTVKGATSTLRREVGGIKLAVRDYFNLAKDWYPIEF